jgi:hypothetical protein
VHGAFEVCSALGGELSVTCDAVGRHQGKAGLERALGQRPDHGGDVRPGGVWQRAMAIQNHAARVVGVAAGAGLGERCGDQSSAGCWGS